MDRYILTPWGCAGLWAVLAKRRRNSELKSLRPWQWFLALSPANIRTGFEEDYGSVK